MISKKIAGWILKGLSDVGKKDCECSLVKMCPESNENVERIALILGDHNKGPQKLREILKGDFTIETINNVSRVSDLENIDGDENPNFNWRGRVLNLSEIQNASKSAAREKILRSYCRIFLNVRKEENDTHYFVYSDLFPYFYKPGWSAMAHQDWKLPVRREMEVILKRCNMEWDTLFPIFGNTVVGMTSSKNIGERKISHDSKDSIEDWAVEKFKDVLEKLTSAGRT